MVTPGIAFVTHNICNSPRVQRLPECRHAAVASTMQDNCDMRFSRPCNHRTAFERRCAQGRLHLSGGQMAGRALLPVEALTPLQLLNLRRLPQRFIPVCTGTLPLCRLLTSG